QEYTSRFRNIFEQVESIDEANKSLYFTKRLKPATKTKVNYRLPDNLEDMICLATIYDTVMYSVEEAGYQVSDEFKNHSSRISTSENIE
ncbi:24458_t:CDS:1, partial [Racocetra persica]